MTNSSRVFSGGTIPDDGVFVTLHEYGHGYHWMAVEPPGDNACEGDHFWQQDNTRPCAFVEGLADFLAMFTLGSRLVVSPHGGDYGLENNLDEFGAPTNPPTGEDGMRVESAVAAFLYDMADNGSEPDASNNGTGSAESFDTQATSAGWILDIIQFCRLGLAGGGEVTQLDGPDQLVYCLEKSPSARTEGLTYSNQWRQYSLIWFYPTVPATQDSTKTRNLWKYNFCGVYPP